MCLYHHFDRIGKHIDLFNSLWFIVVTTATVGYGDISPTHWTGKLLVIAFIIGIILFLPSQLQGLYEAFRVHKMLYDSFSKADSSAHIVLCFRDINILVLRNFLAEFYNDPKNHVSNTDRLYDGRVYCCLWCSSHCVSCPQPFAHSFHAHLPPPFLHVHLLPSLMPPSSPPPS